MNEDSTPSKQPEQHQLLVATVNTEIAHAKEYRMRAWEAQMRGFKELCIALFVVMGGVAFYVFVSRLWHLLPK